jgi:hypothetical protein
MDFQAKEWSFLLRNGLIEHIGCKAGAMALDVVRGIQGLSKAEMTFVGQFTCLNNFGINILI